jgi:hypothetical protein
MQTGTAIVLWLVLVMLFAVVLGYVGPAIDDNSAEFGAANDAIAQIKRDQRLAKVGKTICGDGAAFDDLGNGTIQCRLHSGRKTLIAKAAP